MTKYGYMGPWWLGTGIALPATHPVPHPSPYPGYTPPTRHRTGTGEQRVSDQRYMAVGLKSVAQLTLSRLFSGFLGITEVYNLRIAGRINNHSFIPGNE